ncbi:SIMPL domain-containing protein [Sphingomonas sp. HT-1]|uniref:SIMPL domain-containing protein n=1 Tax=unclassified Sphingomonas TaxID=196159 RepID=UPI000361AA0C|nr:MULTISPECIES: SIMPL domain-containing protein [unclassified Sphingomonas]KTF67743.1 hypothetical protein ATB93_16850 [Sphingomonas sp. WG]
MAWDFLLRFVHMCSEAEEKFMPTRRFLLALALVSAAPAFARSDSSGRAAVPGIAGTAGIDVKLGRVTMTLRYLGEGKTEAEAKKALATKLEKLLQVLKEEGIDPAAIRDLTPQESESLFANVIETIEAEDVESSAAEASEPNFVFSSIKKLSVATVDQANAVQAKLAELDVKTDEITTEPDAA